MAAAILHTDSRHKNGGLFDAVALLPFVQVQKTPVDRLDLWAVPSFGDYEQDEAFGVKCANAAIAHIRARRDILFLQNVVCAMVRKGECGPVEIAFVETIAQTFTEIV